MSSVRVATFDGPGSAPVIREVPRPQVPERAALIRIAACGVCGTDLHILKGHWPKPLPWPFTLGHELAGVIAETGSELTEDFMGLPLELGSKVMLPPLMRFRLDETLGLGGVLPDHVTLPTIRRVAPHPRLLTMQQLR